MKQLLAVIASFILLQQVPVQLSAQTIVPENVTRAFAKKFPAENISKWETRKEGYIAHFKKDGKKHHVYYTHNGDWKATESPVRRTRHLPTAVQTAWKNSSYTGWYVHNIKKIETPERPLYVMHLNNSSLLDANKIDNFKEDHVLYFTHDGELVKTEKI